jgi:hypothetical protein
MGASNLIQRNIRFGLKLHLVGNASLLPSFAVVGPGLRQITAEGHGHAGCLGGRERLLHDSYPVYRPDRNTAGPLPPTRDLFGGSSVIHHPYHYRPLAEQLAVRNPDTGPTRLSISKPFKLFQNRISTVNAETRGQTATGGHAAQAASTAPTLRSGISSSGLRLTLASRSRSTVLFNFNTKRQLGNV